MRKRSDTVLSNIPDPSDAPRIGCARSAGLATIATFPARSLSKNSISRRNQLDATQRKEIVVVFADIVGFTEFVGITSSATNVIDLLQEFHEIAETAVLKMTEPFINFWETA